MGKKGRVAVVTGAASGMGLAIARHLAARGNPVGLLDLQGEAALRAARELGETGATAIAAEADVTDRGTVDAALDKVRKELGPIQIMVTSAGLDAFERFKDITLESWERVLAVNLTGTFHSLQAALPDMLAARWGRMVTISSSSAQSGAPRMAHYVASKGGVIALTNDEQTNLAIAIAARLLAPTLPALCRAERRDTALNMASFGTRHIINPFERFGETLALALRAPSAWLLLRWLTGFRYTRQTRDSMPPRGRWIVCGHGRFAQGLIDVIDGPEVKLPLCDRLDHVRPQHEVVDVGPGKTDSLRPCEAGGPANVEEALDLLVNPADGLHLAGLVDGARDGDVLPERCSGERAQQAHQFGD